METVPRPDIPILVPLTPAALRSGDVTMHHWRISCHVYGRAPVRHSLRPRQVRSCRRDDRVVFDLIVVRAVQHDHVSQESRRELGMGLGPGRAAGVTGVAGEYIVVGSGDQRQNAVLMILLAQFCTLLHGFVWCSALNGPKADPNFSSSIQKEMYLATGLRLDPRGTLIASRRAAT